MLNSAELFLTPLVLRGKHRHRFSSAEEKSQPISGADYLSPRVRGESGHDSELGQTGPRKFAPETVVMFCFTEVKYGNLGFIELYAFVVTEMKRLAC